MIAVLLVAILFVAANVAFILGACRAAAHADRDLRIVLAEASAGVVTALPVRRAPEVLEHRQAG